MYTKYPSTSVLPWSPSSKDNNTFNVSNFEGKEVVVTEKMDGENTTCYQNRIHARSIDSRHHESRSWVKQWHSMYRFNIPEKWRMCGENVYAKHSIYYTDLESYFYLFSVWDENNICLDWDSTKKWARMMSIPTPKEFYRGVWDQKTIQNLQIDTETCEGYVVRLVESFKFIDFEKSLAKWVREGHVQTDEHWMHQEIIPNLLKD